MTMNPNLIFSSLLNWAAPESLIWWLSRATLLSALACVYLATARGARPAIRHIVAVSCLAGVALLPMASALLPALSVPVIPATPALTPAPPATTPVMHAASVQPAPAVEPASAPLPAEPVAPASVRRTKPAGGTASAVTPGAAVLRLNWPRILVTAWLTVAAGLMLRIVIATLRARRFALGAVAAVDERLLQEHARAQHVLGITRPVAVATSSAVAIPLAVGVLRPRVVLPAAATGWSRERLSVVFLHELAHVRRRDGLWLFLSRVVTSLLWFHPLMWTLSRHVRQESERACDEMVLDSGVRGSDYAGHLVSIARTAMGPAPLPASALAFAARSTLETRIASILTACPRRGPMSRRALVSLAGTSLIVLGAIAAVHPTRVVSAQLPPGEEIPLVTAAVVAPVTAAVRATDVAAIAARDAQRAMRVDYQIAQELRRSQRMQMRYEVAKSRNHDDSGRDSYHEAHALYQNHRYRQAAEAYRQAAELGYNSDTALYNAGCSYALADKPDEAIAALRESMEEGFDRPDLFASDDDLNSLRDKPEFQKLLGEVMNSDAAMVQRKRASKDYERLESRKDAVDDGEWNSVGIDLMRSGDYKRADTAFEREFKVSGDTDAIYNRACASSLAGDKAVALQYLEQAITGGSVDVDHMEEDPDLVPLHKEKRFDELVTMADMLTLNHGNNWTWGRNSDERYWSKSLPRLEKATQQYPQVGRAWFNLGFAQLKSGDAKSSTASFTKALDMGYQKPTTMYNLACTSAQTGDLDAAFKWLESAENEGFEMWSRARHDEDLDPLHGDPRYSEARKRWREQEKKSKHTEWHWNDDDEDDES
ncbi:MAG TPA: M56 family metallopeptidase [Candidatus Krumholzibacteria bacterium]|nr:M56 family metallopeptidase [Candidatus Krumholzibacteria bacterium]